MIKNVTQFKAIINEVECIFSFDANCPTNVAKEKKAEEQPAVEAVSEPVLEEITEVVNE